MKINAELIIKGSLVTKYEDKADVKVEDVNPPLNVLVNLEDAFGTDISASAGTAVS